MENNELQIVIDFLSKNLQIQENQINNNTTLSCLGVDGDDTLELMICFFEEFKIEYKTTDYLNYIPVEGGFFLKTILSLFSKPKIDLSKEIQVKDLVHSMKIKRWEKLNQNNEH